MSRNAIKAADKAGRIAPLEFNQISLKIDNLKSIGYGLLSFDQPNCLCENCMDFLEVGLTPPRDIKHKRISDILLGL